MSELITIISSKGGVGKTALSGNIVEYLNIRKSGSACILDLDSRKQAFKFSNLGGGLIPVFKSKKECKDFDFVLVDTEGVFTDSYNNELKQSDLIIIPAPLDIGEVMETVSFVKEYPNYFDKMVLIPNKVKAIRKTANQRGVNTYENELPEVKILESALTDLTVFSEVFLYGLRDSDKATEKALNQLSNVVKELGL